MTTANKFKHWLTVVERARRMAACRQWSRARRLPALAFIAMLALVSLAACGGGEEEAGIDDPPAQARYGALSGTVTDRYGAPVASANVSIAFSNGGGRTLSTSASGQYSLIDVPVGSTTVQASAAEFSPTSMPVNVGENQNATANVVLQRIAAPIAAVVGARVVSSNATSAVFAIDIFAADATGASINNLASTNFSIAGFTSSTSGATYTFTQNSVSTATQSVVGPYSVMLLLDQSGSITGTDPTDARLFAAKVFLESLGSGDNVQLAAFASGGSLAFSPVTVYGSGFTSDGRSYFSTVDQLGNLEGGNTPLYQSTYSAMVHTRQNGPNTNRAVVVFTDGNDTDGVRTIADIGALSAQNGVRVFTVGLSNGIDVGTLAEMARLGRGAYFHANSARQLISTFGSLGKLLNGSAAVYSTRWSVTVDRSAFGSGAWFSTGVRIDTPSGQLVAPFRITF